MFASGISPGRHRIPRVSSKFGQAIGRSCDFNLNHSLEVGVDRINGLA